MESVERARRCLRHRSGAPLGTDGRGLGVVSDRSMPGLLDARKTLPNLVNLANPSTVRVRVRFSETDLMGIVHHASYLSYMEVARVEWLRRRGVTYARWAESGVHLPVVEVGLKYRSSARFDDELDVEVGLGEVRAASVRFDYRIARAEEKQKVCVEGSIRLACVDARHALKRFSPEMAEVFARPEGAAEESAGRGQEEPSVPAPPRLRGERTT